MKLSLQDQQRFAGLSGDYNPIHVDPIVARRFVYGVPIAHGIHLLLLALEEVFENDQEPCYLTSLTCDFRKAVPIGTEFSYKIQRSNERATALILADGLPRGRIRLAWCSAEGDSNFPQTASNAPPQECVERSIESLTDCRGELGLFLDKSLLAECYPCIAQALPSIQLAELLSFSRLVGMECPGLHSIFAKLTVRFKPERAGESRLALQYTAQSYDERFSLLSLEIEGPSLLGQIEALARPKPVEQDSFEKIQELVPEMSFVGQSALVLGGSRGLGEVTAKILAAGGADVCLTYHKGQEDAVAVANSLKGASGKPSVLPWNVLGSGPCTPALSEALKGVTHLYYFATPTIPERVGQSLDEALLASFMSFYVSGFNNAVSVVRQHSQSLRGVFYPSSIYVEQLPKTLREYVIAKSAGEAMCQLLEKQGLSIYRPRLPVLQTDQTVSVLSTVSEAPTEFMYDQLKSFWTLTNERGFGNEGK
jgi:hypothetical protein